MAANSNKKHPREPPAVPFLWEERPGIPKKDWKPPVVSSNSSFPAPPIVKLVASVPFKWEEKPGTPLPSFSEPTLESACPSSLPLQLITFPSPPISSHQYDYDGENEDYGDDISGNGDGEDGAPSMFNLELEAFDFETDDSFISAPALLANCLVPSIAISTAVPADKSTPTEDKSAWPETPSSPASEAGSSTSSYATGVSSLVGASFLECLFPLIPANSGFLEKIGQSGNSSLTPEELINSLRGTLKSVKDIPHILKKFNSPSSICTSGDWTAFLKSVCSLLHVNKIFEVGVSESLQEHAKYLNLDIVEKAASCITTELAYVYELVIGVLDVSRSKEKGYETIVKDDFCDELDELRQIYEELPEFLEEVSQMELGRLPQLYKEKFVPCIVYIHQIGYLMCIFEEKLDEATLEKVQDFEFAFSDAEGETKRFFYHTAKTRELDNLLGDIYHKILDMERAITRDLVSHILLFSEHLLKAVNFAAELDCFLSLALVSRQSNYVRPTLTMDCLIDIQNGRHVLQEMTVDTFVPNDTMIQNEGRINIITGPNYSGKSIYIKQVALIVFLSHIGSFVPADAATIGLTDRIFCAMGSKLMNAEKSTFMIDLHQVGMMLRQATSRSLCLLDEFGKGTLTEDGVGLLGGTINYLVSHDDPPKVLVCTHLTELFSESCLPKSKKIEFYTMSVLRPDNSTDIEDIVFLYRLVPGHALLSYGLHCALLAGVPEEVIKRAAFILEALGNNEHIERLCNENVSAQDQQYQNVVDKMLAFDFQKGDIGLFFQGLFSAES